MTADYGISIDWNGDGDFSDTGEDVTARVLSRSGISVEYGRDQSRALSPISPGHAGFELDNLSGDYSPENTSSPLNGMILPARPVLIDATLASTTYTLFRGHLDDFDLMPGLPERSVEVTCLDGLAALAGVRLNTPLHHSIQTGTAVGLILDAVGWPADKRDLDIGASTIRWWWEEDTDAWQALQKVVQAEGPPAFAFLGADGSIVFRDRHHRITDAASLTSQATFRSTVTEPLFSSPLVYDHGWRDIVNAVTFSIEERGPDSLRSVVWSTDAIHQIADGETLSVDAQATQPFFDAATPTSGTDFSVQSGTVSVSLSRTSGQSATIFIRATGGPARIAGLQLRAYAVPVKRTAHVNMEDPVSIGRYGRRTWPDDPVWLAAADALAVASVILAQRADRLPVVSLPLVNGNDTRLTQQLTRDLSDRIHIVEPEFGLDDDFFIERINHRVGSAGLFHETVFGCEKAPGQISNVFRFDVTGAGFDDGKFGLSGLDDPANVFRFDVTGHGFDDGMFAT